MATRFNGTSTKPPNPNTTFPVYADVHWNPSNFAVQKGQTYRIEVQGEQVRNAPHKLALVLNTISLGRDAELFVGCGHVR
jgi:hypothetical protein